MWQTPKTSWAATDEFRLEPDYERIRGNLEHLQAWAARIARRAELTPMPDESVDGLSTAEIASVEDLPVDQVKQIIADGAEELAAIRQHMQSMGWLEED